MFDFLRFRTLTLLAAGWWCAAPLAGQEIVQYNRLEREDIFKRLAKLTGDAAERRATLRELFEEAGCKGGDLLEQPVEGTDQPNLICRLPGSTGEVIVAGAHYDAPPGSPGASGNWSGAVLLPSLYQSLKQETRRHTFYFVAFGAGTDRRKGSRSYVKSLSKEEARSIRAMVNLESPGLTRPMAWEYGGGRRLASAMRSIAGAVMLPVDIMEPHKPGRIDAESFARRGIPAIAIHSISQYNHHIRHSPEDTLDAIKRDEYYETYMLTAAYLAYLDMTLQ